MGLIDDLGTTFGFDPGTFGPLVGAVLVIGIALMIALLMDNPSPMLIVSVVTVTMALNIMLGLWPIWTAILIVLGFGLVLTFWRGSSSEG